MIINNKQVNIRTGKCNRYIVNVNTYHYDLTNKVLSKLVRTYNIDGLMVNRIILNQHFNRLNRDISIISNCLFNHSKLNLIRWIHDNKFCVYEK